MAKRKPILLTAIFLTLGLIANTSAPAQTRSCQLPPQFPCPDARIMDFKADATSIKPGQSVVLTWAAENPGPMTVTPGVGAVTARGSARVTPSATTTYTLTVAGGPGGEVLRRTLTVTVNGTTPGAGPSLNTATPQTNLRTPDGKP